MNSPMVFVQARMASRRFPGKVLAPLGGKPVIARVLMRVARAVPLDQIVLCTTSHPSDDPLARFVEYLNVTVFRGVGNDVVGRLQDCLFLFPCERFFRVCGDSPLLDPTLFARFLEVPGNPDLVTNVFPRTFPKGQSLELIRSDTFLDLNVEVLTSEEREHPTRFFYDHQDEYSIVNITSKDELECLGDDVAVDTVEDLHRIEALL